MLEQAARAFPMDDEISSAAARLTQASTQLDGRLAMSKIVAAAQVATSATATEAAKWQALVDAAGEQEAVALATGPAGVMLHDCFKAAIDNIQVWLLGHEERVLEKALLRIGTPFESGPAGRSYGSTSEWWKYTEKAGTVVERLLKGFNLKYAVVFNRPYMLVTLAVAVEAQLAGCKTRGWRKGAGSGYDEAGQNLGGGIGGDANAEL